jgi:hypothetical protein
MRSFPLLAALATAMTLSACSSGSPDKAGSEKPAAGEAGADDSRSYQVTGFTGVELAGPDNVVVKQGAAFTATATGPQDVLNKLELVVRDGKLIVRRQSEFMNWSSGQSATITVTMPALTSAEVTGSGSLTADRAAGDAISASVAGSGDLELTLVEAKSVDLSLAGAGDLVVKGGKADRGDISLAGSGDVSTTGLSLTAADISLAGSGDIDATATGTADVSVAGSGDVRVGGGAKCDSSEIGSGSVTCK